VRRPRLVIPTLAILGLGLAAGAIYLTVNSGHEPH
jgi:hypothetical protein